MIYCCTANPVIDVMYDMEKLNCGATCFAEETRFEPAGKAINVAKVVRTLGEDVAITGLMPREGAELFEISLRQLGIPSFFFRVSGYVRVNVSIHTREDNRTTHINGCGPMVRALDIDAFSHFILKLARQGDRWALCGSILPGCDARLYEHLIKILRGRGVSSMLDTRGDALRFGILARPNMIKPNCEELEEYFGEKIRGIHHIALRAKMFLDKGIEYIFVSLGSDGLIAVHGNDCLLCSTPAVQAVDTVGCGDALVAGLLVGMQRKYSWTETCRLAVACGASKAMHYGRGIIDPQEVNRMMEDVQIKSI